MINSFEIMNQQGQEGERIFYDICENNGWHVVDHTETYANFLHKKTDNAIYYFTHDYESYLYYLDRYKGIDFTIVHYDDPALMYDIDVKNTTTDEGFVLFEYEQHINQKKTIKGWGQYSQADYIFYRYKNLNYSIAFNLADMQKYISENKVEELTLNNAKCYKVDLLDFYNTGSPICLINDNGVIDDVEYVFTKISRNRSKVND